MPRTRRMRRKLARMATPREYEVVLMTEEEGGFSVTVPALPGCTSQGETREEALSMIREAIEVYIESLVAHGDPIPGPVEIERVTVAA
jgi:antitoxin HicB